MVFFGVFTHYCTKSLAILLQCSHDTQTYRMLFHFNLKSGIQKLSHKTVVNFYLPLQKFQVLAGVDFRSVKF